MKRNGRKYRGPAGGQSGFTLVELLVSIAISVVVAGSLYGVYTMFFTKANTQDLKVECQQNARAGIDYIERELVNAGYAPGSTAEVLSEAAAGSIEFTFRDPAIDSGLTDTFNKRLKVKYTTETTGGVSYLVRNMGVCADSDCMTYENTRSNEAVIPDVSSFVINYYDEDGGEITAPLNADARETVRFVTVTLATQTAEVLMGTGQRSNCTVKTNMRIRNIGAGTTATDTTAPSAPTDLLVRDQGKCGQLNTKWTLSTDGDVGGYKVYYAPVSGDAAYTGVIDIPLTSLTSSTYSCTKTSTEMTCAINPIEPALNTTDSNAVAPTVYNITVKAYDTSYNTSSASNVANGNPDPSNADFGTTGDDTTINPAVPAAISGFDGMPGASDGEVVLSWSAYDTNANYGVEGFRLYRSTEPFDTYPIDPSNANIELIAGEPLGGAPVDLDADAIEFTDSGSLKGCYTYYYAIAPVNCDTALVTSYEASNYGVAYGNGVDSIYSYEPLTDYPVNGVTNTSPNDTTAPAAPSFTAKAGWNRVAVSLTQPSDTDFDQTCVYVNEGGGYPVLQTDTELYPLEYNFGCYSIDYASIYSSMIPDYAVGAGEEPNYGVFTALGLVAGDSMAFWHDSMWQAEPSAPELQAYNPETGEGTTYSYRAVSFDLCGNGSDITGAQATTTICDEDPAVDEGSGLKPPAVTNVEADCCDLPVSLSWTAVSSDTGSASSYNNPYDLAGYRIFRSTSTDFSAAELVSGDAPFWGTEFSDAGVTEGIRYYYRIVTLDCPYERGNDTGGTIPTESQIRSHMNSGYLNSVLVGPVTPGSIDRDEKCYPEHPDYPACAPDNHREVITGVNMNNVEVDGSSDPQSSFYHDTVTLFLDNASAGPMTINDLTLKWENSLAYLTKVEIGGGRSGVSVGTTLVSNSATDNSTSPYNKQVGDLVINKQLDAGADYIPIVFTFADVSGDPVDMRDDILSLELVATNDATATTTCVSFPTISGKDQSITVPLGPSITAVQQNQPSIPTFTYAVPGASGLNTVPTDGTNGEVAVGVGVDVILGALVFSNTIDQQTGIEVPIKVATLYYFKGSISVGTMPDPETDTYTPVTMSSPDGYVFYGMIDDATLNGAAGDRIWYYIVVEDDDGNFDRAPEAGEGAYVYDIKGFDACEFTPAAPTGVSAVSDGLNPATITVTWDPVTTYSGGDTINEADSVTYAVIPGHDATVNPATSPYSDAGLAIDSIYSYNVVALNSCPNDSAHSDTASVCTGTGDFAVLGVTPDQVYPGESYSLNIVDCDAMGGGDELVINKIGDAGDPNFDFLSIGTTNANDLEEPYIEETAVASGTFDIVLQTAEATAVVGDGTTQVDQYDTITVAYATGGAGSAEINVIPDPCTVAPVAITDLSGTIDPSNRTGDLTWSGPSPDPLTITGYSIWRNVDATGWIQVGSAAAGATGAAIEYDGTLKYNQAAYSYKVTITNSCNVTSDDSNVWADDVP